ncbi:MAG: ATP-binding protein [Desulfobacterales bacterium]|nr:ATP-binding protein [Desulfobacterales bacterium]
MNSQPNHNLPLERLSSVLREQYEAFSNVDLGTPREILPEITAGLASPKIMVITGLRRVGKSTLLAQIAQTHLSDNFFFVNFEDERLLSFTADQFDHLHEALIGLFGERKIFLFDEIQNVAEWERFVRRLHDQGYQFIITGSNSSLLGQELGTKLTGRSLRYELFPFSFTEYIKFHRVELPKTSTLTTSERGALLKHSREYLVNGGIPDALKYPQLDILKTLYNDVLYRDIAARYGIDNVKSLQELTFYLISNPASEISFNKLKTNLKLGSVNTVKKYISYLENAWLFFTINKYAYSVKEQQIAAKKIYSIDTGMLNSVGFSFSKNIGKIMENLVFLQLRRHHQDIFYYKTNQNHEVDFYVPSQQLAIQVSQELSDEETRLREFRSLIELSEEKKEQNLLQIVTLADRESITIEGTTMEVLPLYEWLLSAQSP